MRTVRKRLLLALGLPVLLGVGPCGPITGGRLSADLQPASAPADWSFTNEISTVQVETLPSDPYSVTTWCFTDGPNLYVPSRGAEEKAWVKNVLADPQVRVRIGDSVYDMRATRVTDEAELRRIVPLLLAKYSMARWSMDPDPATNPGTWYFRLAPAA